MVECEFAVFLWECLRTGKRRIADVGALNKAAAAWAEENSRD